MTLRRPARPVVAGMLALMAAGCGLKGPLAMPERSTNIVIRGPDGKSVTDGAATPPPGDGQSAAGTPPPGDPAAPAAPAAPVDAAAPAPTTPAPADETLPPPPLPGRRPGARGG